MRKPACLRGTYLYDTFIDTLPKSHGVATPDHFIIATNYMAVLAD